jgi:hypothetical protein
MLSALLYDPADVPVICLDSLSTIHEGSEIVSRSTFLRRGVRFSPDSAASLSQAASDAKRLDD